MSAKKNYCVKCWMDDGRVECFYYDSMNKAEYMADLFYLSKYVRTVSCWSLRSGVCFYVKDKL